MKYVITDLSKKSRKMLLTINNPDKQGTAANNRELVPAAMLQAACHGNDNAKADLKNTVKNYIDDGELVKGKTEVYYCFSLEVGDKGSTPHIHIFFQFANPRFGNKVKKVFPAAHIDYCNGSNQSIRDYVLKCGKWESSEKEDTRINGTQYESGDLPAEKGQGERSDLEMIKDLIDGGMTPKEVLATNPNFYRHENCIGKMFYDKRCSETPIKREINVTVHTGVSGSGKSNVLTILDQRKVFIGADYSNALFDGYEGEEILFLDEFRGQIPYNQLLIDIDGYKVPIHARYFNKYSLWNEVHITSVIPVEEWYKNDNIRDTFEQLKRRISKIVFHLMYDKKTRLYISDKMAFLKNHKKEDIGYAEYVVDAAQYESYGKLEEEALAECGVLRPVEWNGDWDSLDGVALPDDCAQSISAKETPSDDGIPCESGCLNLFEEYTAEKVVATRSA